MLHVAGVVRKAQRDVTAKGLTAGDLATRVGGKLMLNADEVGDLFGLTGAWVRKRCRMDDFPIPHRLIGGVRLWSVYDVEAYLRAGGDKEADAS